MSGFISLVGMLLLLFVAAGVAFVILIALLAAIGAAYRGLFVR